MNIYVVVEGSTELKVFPNWIKVLNPDLTEIDHPSDVTNNCFYVVSGCGYPQYFEILEDAIADVNGNPAWTRLIICLDSEDMTYHEKFEEVDAFLFAHPVSIDYRIVIQHFCFEAWALGNQAIIPSRPRNPLHNYMQLHNVETNDPELLPAYNQESLNRAQFAKKYLNIAINQRWHRYSTIDTLAHEKYMVNLISRESNTGHISSILNFLNAF